MPTLKDIQKRLAEVAEKQQDPAVQAVIQQLEAQQFKAEFSAEFIQQCCKQFALSPVELALKCLPIAASYALVPVSHFYVGAVAIGESGCFYFGANQEYAGIAIQQTVHAEQSAIAHAWHCGEKRLTDIVVNYTPCGHCRQFMNELNSASELKIHLPHSQNNLLHGYLPDAFGPRDLNIKQVLFDPQTHQFKVQGTMLEQAAIQAAEKSYAPYSQAMSAVAMQVGDKIITGRYAENAAFNPSFQPMQSALNQRRMQGLTCESVSRVVLAEKSACLSQRAMCEALCRQMLQLELSYLPIA